MAVYLIPSKARFGLAKVRLSEETATLDEPRGYSFSTRSRRADRFLAAAGYAERTLANCTPYGTGLRFTVQRVGYPEPVDMARIIHDESTDEIDAFEDAGEAFKAYSAWAATVDGFDSEPAESDLIPR